MNDPDGPEQRQADLDESSEYEYDELDRMERQGDFDADEALLDLASDRLNSFSEEL